MDLQVVSNIADVEWLDVAMLGQLGHGQGAGK
jgi:hypothetical protein